MKSRTFKVTIVRDGSMCFIPVPFDPAPVFGKIRAPVKVTVNGHTYRSTIASMGGTVCIPLRKSNREAAGLEGGERVEVRLDLDTEAREVAPPPDLVKALEAAPPAVDRWRDLSYSHQREYVEAIETAKKAETRARRIENAVRTIAARPEKGVEPGHRNNVMKGEVPLRIIVERPPRGVAFGVQRGRSELLAPAEVRDDSLTFAFTVRVDLPSGKPPNFLGEFAQGPKDARFVYVNSGKRAGQQNTYWDRRAKVPLAGISSSLVKQVMDDARSVLEVRIEGVGRDGGPVCASVRLGVL